MVDFVCILFFVDTLEVLEARRCANSSWRKPSLECLMSVACFGSIPKQFLVNE